MRGWYRVVSASDPRWNKVGRDFICPNRGPLNFDMQQYVEDRTFELGADPPADLKLYVDWEKKDVKTPKPPPPSA